MTSTEIFLSALAGLGLFFVGIKMIARNLSAMASDQLRRRLKKASQRVALASLFGAVAGFITQSGRTTAFIMASFVQGGLIEAKRAIPIVIWSNFGCALIIFAAIFPIHLFALFLLAAAGACVAFERPRPLQNSANASFGLALMLFGLRMMSSSANLLTDLHWFGAALDLIHASLALAFLTGLLATIVAQSHMAIVLITVTMASRGLFDFNQTLMLIYGAHAGSSLITLITGFHFRGQPRQLVAAQILYNMAGIALFLILFLADYFLAGDEQLMHRLTASLSPLPGTQAAFVAVIFNAATPLLLMALLPGFARLCARLAPPLADEELARPQFLRDEVRDNAVATLLLAEQEQLRLLKRLPDYMAWIREPGARRGPSPDAYHDAFLHVSDCIGRSQAALMAHRMSGEDTEWLLNQQKRQALLAAVEEACRDLTRAAQGVGAEVQPMLASIVEAMDTIVLTAIGAMTDKDPVELDMLDKMTGNGGSAMESARKKYLSLSDTLPAEQRSRILEITSLFERAAWSLGKFGALLRASPGMAG